MLNRRYMIDKLVITAMDRFVWFILLIVMSHLVTEFTRVTGYTRGTRNDVVLLNDTENIAGRTVQNMLLYPGQENSVYDHQYPQQQHQQQQQQQQSNQFFNRFQAANTNNNQQQQQSSQYNTGTSSNNEQSFGFSFRPLIDSIFEIPISTLRAVNNLVARLTGSYRQAQTTTQGFVGKTSQAAAVAISDVQKSAMPLVAAVQDLTVKPATKKATMRELNA